MFSWSQLFFFFFFFFKEKTNIECFWFGHIMPKYIVIEEKEDRKPRPDVVRLLGLGRQRKCGNNSRDELVCDKNSLLKLCDLRRRMLYNDINERLEIAGEMVGDMNKEELQLVCRLKKLQCFRKKLLLYKWKLRVERGKLDISGTRLEDIDLGSFPVRDSDSIVGE